PLDFAAVTDHAEQLGEVHICTTPGAPGHGSLVCRIQRRFPRFAFFLMNSRVTFLETRWGFCGPEGATCLAAAHTVWREIQAAAEGAYDRSAACAFTSFVGYEWTAGAGRGKNLHRNVIFRGARVPELPTSFVEARSAWALWNALEEECTAAGTGCDVLTIPHNSNLSGGLLFESARLRSEDDAGMPIDGEEAARRARWEPLVEIMQHKGDSECMLSGDTTDELCGFEKLPYDSFGAKFYSFLGREEPAPSNFVREALKEGLRIRRARGADPFHYGIVASTDTHLATPGLADERGYPGHGGAGAPAASRPPGGLPDDLEFNPGGLAVLWAEENTREALFAAMRRREAYGTSGTRPTVRFFGAWELPEDLCARDDLAAQGYARGVPMGGDLPVPAASAAPRFVVDARRDPGAATSPGTPLERVQIVKGWVDAAGASHERVVDVAGGDREAGVDPATCARHGEGHDRLCAVWTDPSFDPAQEAFYYARVVETPTCRWSQHLCVARGVDCDDPSTVGPGLDACCAPEHRPVIRERAWTAPVGYLPP
ncbi:MAG: DUF3604 domain-containing protein, partial [Myxococcota bacterium]|nr:DUF3604 domain-containing protein [Myxococcota bacterium]